MARVLVVDYVETPEAARHRARAGARREDRHVLWTQEWPVDYRGISYGNGPRATPTVDGDRVYVRRRRRQAVLPRRQDRRDHLEEGLRRRLQRRPHHVGVRLGLLELAARRRRSPDRLWSAAGQRQGGRVRQDDRQGALARAATETELGVAQPIIVTAGGVRQLIVWYPGRGRIARPGHRQGLLEQPYKVGSSMTVATPVRERLEVVLHDLLRRPVDAAARRQAPAATCCGRARATARSRPMACTRRSRRRSSSGTYIYGICSYGPVPRVCGEHRRARVGDAGGDQRDARAGPPASSCATANACSSTTTAAS